MKKIKTNLTEVSVKINIWLPIPLHEDFNKLSKIKYDSISSRIRKLITEDLINNKKFINNPKSEFLTEKKPINL